MTSRDRPVRDSLLAAPAARLAVPAIALALSGCASSSVLNTQGPVGAAEITILFNSLAIMLAIVVPTIAATIGIAWWFRASNTRAEYMPTWAYSGRLELVVWSIPVLVILFLGGIAWISSHDLDPYKPLQSANKPVEVQVVSLDWKWLFIYPDQGVASLNQLVIPAGTPVHFTLTSASVMSAFFVPQLGGMIYTMNGMTTQLNLQADHEGTFHGLSSHYSGDGFSDMHFDVKSVPAAGFDDWVKTAKGTGNALDAAAYGELAKQSKAVAPATFKSVDADLFQSIVSQKLAPGPGPQDGPEADVSPRSGG